MSTWEAILLTLGGQATLVLVLGFLARGLFNNWLNKDLERHSAMLEHQNQQALVAMRHDLGKAAQEHSLKATELLTRRAAVIAEIYGLLADVEWESSVYVSNADLTGQNKSEAQYELLTQKIESFYRYFNRNRIYLPEDTCSSVWLLMNGMVQATNKMKGYLYDTAQPGRTVTTQMIDALQSAHEHFGKHHGEARRILERDLRAIMGDKPPHD